MGKWSDEITSKYTSTKLGSVVTMKIKEINRVTDKLDFEPKTKDGKGQGFMFEFVGEDDSIISIGTFALQRALADSGVDVGDTIKISHLEHGIYTIEKV